MAPDEYEQQREARRARARQLRAAGHIVDGWPAEPVALRGGDVPDMGEGLLEEPEPLPVDVAMQLGLTEDDR